MTPKYDGTTTLPVDFTRPYIGYGAGRLKTFGASSSLHSLQVSANRRMARGVQLGLAYTWSKALGTASAYDTTGHPTDMKKADYGPLSFDRTQVLTLNYIWELPNAAPKGSFLDNAAARVILNGWQLSGITSFSSGAPTTPSWSRVGVGTAVNNRMITGTETWAPRVVLLSDPNLSPGDRKLEAWIDTSGFRPAAKGSQGVDSGPMTVRRPGTNNWDVALYKRIRLGADERRYVQLRLETYNTFNHTQWSSVNTSAQFDATGKLTNLPTSLGGGGGRFGFGALSGVSSARRIQIAAKIYF